MISDIDSTESNSRLPTSRDATATSSSTNDGPVAQLRFSRQPSKLQRKMAALNAPSRWQRQRISVGPQRPLKVLNFEVLSRQWKDRPKRAMKNWSELRSPQKSTKRLPDSGSTVDPSQPRTPKIKLCDLEIKSIVSLSDEQDNGSPSKPKTVRVEQSMILVNFFRGRSKQKQGGLCFRQDDILQEKRLNYETS